VITWTIKLKIVSIVKLDPQRALITIGTHIVNTRFSCILFMLSGEPQGSLVLTLDLSKSICSFL